MKVRCGYVSNSSSSSFCILGIQLNSYDNRKQLKMFSDYNCSLQEFGEFFSRQTGLDVGFNLLCYASNNVYGVSVFKLSEDKTILENRKEVLKLLSAFFKGLTLDDVKFFINEETPR